MNSKLWGLGAQKRFQVERETEATHHKVTDWVGGREETQQESKRKREREEQIRSQDLKLAGVRWPH